MSDVEQLYQQSREALTSYFLRRHRSSHTAEDLLQETFLQIWKTARSYDAARGKPLGWLITLTRSRAIDRLRSRQARANRANSWQPLGARWKPSGEFSSKTQMSRS